MGFVSVWHFLFDSALYIIVDAPLPCCTNLLYYIIASLNDTNCTNIHGIVLRWEILFIYSYMKKNIILYQMGKREMDLLLWNLFLLLAKHGVTVDWFLFLFFSPKVLEVKFVMDPHDWSGQEIRFERGDGDNFLGLSGDPTHFYAF